jgi:hypothetical protein
MVHDLLNLSSTPLVLIWGVDQATVTQHILNMNTAEDCY